MVGILPPAARFLARSTAQTVAVVAFLAAGCYLKSLTGEFVFDDVSSIQGNEDIYGESTTLGEIFSHDFWGSPMHDSRSNKSFRPVTILLFRALHYVFGFAPAAFHALDILCHVVASILLVFVALRLFEQPSSALVCGSLFAVHPIHTEAVANATGMADVLAAIFFLGAFLAYMRLLETHASASSTAGSTAWHYLLLMLCLGTIAMLCKETGVTIFAVVGAYDLFAAGGPWFFSSPGGPRLSSSRSATA